MQFAIAVILILVVLTVAVIVRFLLPPRARLVELPAVPDAPQPFGPSMAWIAVRSPDLARMIQVLELTEAAPANWDAGIGTIYDAALADTHIFLSPPIKGYTFIAGVPLPLPAGRAFVDKLTPLLAKLAAEFKHVQYFACFPQIDFYAWARLEKGRIVRAFAIGEEGVIWDRGRLTPEERALGLKLFELRGIRGRKGDMGEAIILHPTEGQVLRLACGWSLDPSGLDRVTAEPGKGMVARAPSSWRTQRLRKAA